MFDENKFYSDLKETKRHILVVGQTGSGKTANIMMPALYDVLNSGNPALVIDAKNEYEREVLSLTQGCHKNITVLDGHSEKIDYFAYDDEVCLTDKVMRLYSSIESIRPENNGNNANFAARAASLLKNIVIIVEQYHQQTNLNLIYEANKMYLDQSDKPYSGFFSELRYFLDTTLEQGMYSQEKSNKTYDSPVHTCQKLLMKTTIEKTTYGFLTSMVGGRGVSIDQLLYSVQYISVFLDLVLSPTVLSYMELEPFNQNDNSLIDYWDENGVVLLKLDPSLNDDASMDFVGQRLKSIFFKYSFNRVDKTKTLYYVCDEFHRFITADRETGDQNFLDRCRSENVVCILATQSIQSLENATAHSMTSSKSLAIDILLSNTPNKMFFSTTDVKTQDYLEKITPKQMHSGLPDVFNVRPLSTLGTGQCYYFMSGGGWGIKSFDYEAVNEYKLNISTVFQQKREIEDLLVNGWNF